MNDTAVFIEALYGSKPADSLIVISTKNGNGLGEVRLPQDRRRRDRDRHRRSTSTPGSPLWANARRPRTWGTTPNSTQLSDPESRV